MRQIDYKDFDLHIDALPDGLWRAEVTGSPRGQTEDRLLLRPEAAGELSTRLAAGRHSHTGAQRQEQDLLAAARALFEPLLKWASTGVATRAALSRLMSVAPCGYGRSRQQQWAPTA